MSGFFMGKDLCDEHLGRLESCGEGKVDDAQTDPGGETDSLPQQQQQADIHHGLARKGLLPEISDALIASYQANYSFSNAGSSGSTAEAQGPKTGTAEEPLDREAPETTDPRKRGEKRKNAGWFHIEEDKNTNVYVSGMPPDITVAEFTQLMSKFGIIMRDPHTEEFKVKLYKDDQGNLKGDGLCCYLRKESVQLAVKLLDEDQIRGYKLHVEVAKFQLKGEYDVSKKKKQCKDYKKKLSLQQKQLDWRPERRAGTSRMSHERVVIIKNMFQPMDFDEDPLVLNEIREDLRVECSKFGQIRKLLLFDRHPDGVASVSFRNAEEADYCIQTLDKRWFGGRQITAQVWDGTTDYLVEETSREREDRLRGWDEFLNAPEANRVCQNSNSTSERAGNCRIKHCSEHPSKSKMNLQETANGMTFEVSTEDRIEKTKRGIEFEEPDSGQDAKEDTPEKEVKENSPEREYKPSTPEIQSDGSFLKKDLVTCSSRKEVQDEGCPPKEMQENGPDRECKERGKTDGEEDELVKESLDIAHNQESQADGSLKAGPGEEISERVSEEDCSARPSEGGFEKEFKVKCFEKYFEKDGSDRELPEKQSLLEKMLDESNTSEFAEASGSVLEECYEREHEEDAEDKEDGSGKVSDEKENEEDAGAKGYKNPDEKEQYDTDEKLFHNSDKREDVDQKKDEEVDEILSGDKNPKGKSFHEKEFSTGKFY